MGGGQNMVVELADCNIKWCHSRGFPVFGVGQPSEAGFSKVSEKVSKDKCIWFNMRQEPVAYVGGQPVTPRKTVNPHDNMEIPGKVDDMDNLENYKNILAELSAGPVAGLTVVRVPVQEEKALPEECFDVIVKALVEENPAKT